MTLNKNGRGLVVDRLIKVFDNGMRGIDDCSFEVQEGEFLTLLGPSGCGKSTTLRCIAGLERPTAGSIAISGQIVTAPEARVHIAPERRNIGMVFQSYALWPHMSVFENVAFPLKMRKIKREEIPKKVEMALELVGLADYGPRFAGTLSGGQQQRVALARGIVHEPDLLLFDEPLSNLDANLRERMRIEIRNLQRKLGITTVYVTHDQVEAMSMSDRVIIMSEGRIAQIDSPRAIYERPKSTFVAAFVGIANLFEAVVVSREKEGMILVELESQPGLRLEVKENNDATHDPKINILVRPEDIEVTEASDTAATVIGAVTEVEYLGAELALRVSVGKAEARVRCSNKQHINVGDEVGLIFHSDRCVIVPK